MRGGFGMDIYSRRGTKVEFTGRGGGDWSREHAKKAGLVIGQVYTVEYTDVHSSSTDVHLLEFPGTSFNSCLFDEPLDPKRRVEYQHWEPDISGDAYCNVCFDTFHYDVKLERGMYRREDGVLRLECPKCLARNE